MASCLVADDSQMTAAFQYGREFARSSMTARSAVDFLRDLVERSPPQATLKKNAASSAQFSHVQQAAIKHLMVTASAPRSQRLPYC